MKQKIKYLFLLCSITLNADRFSFLFYNDVFARWDKERFKEFSVELGVVGKESGTEFFSALLFITAIWLGLN